MAEEPDPRFAVDFPTLWVALDWVPQHCVIPDGFRRGEPFEQLDWQLWCQANFYRVRRDAVWDPRDPVLAPAFQYRRAQIVLPQKALAVDTPIATPSGWSTMGELVVGDQVFDQDGRPARVLAKSPVWNSDTYRVRFSDGAELTACGDHAWVVDRRTPSSTYVEERLSTRQLLTYGLTEPGGARRFRVRNASALQAPDADLPIDPYVLGAWLGDGHSDDGRITGLDDGVFERIEQAGFEVRRSSIEKRRGVQGLAPVLRRLGLLRNKHIPAQYLRGSQRQRWALLQGLMDTDGYADLPQGKCEFTTVLPALRDGVLELLRSLGIRPMCYAGEARLNGRITGPKWRIAFSARSDMPVFGLERKQARLKPPGRSHAQYEHRRIVAIEPVASVPTQCITVNSETHTFLAGRDMIPTGNSGKGPYTATQCCIQAVGPALFAGWAQGGEVWDCRDHDCGCGWIYEYEPGEPMGMPWPTPLIQVTAYSEDATDNVYDALRPMIDRGPLADLIPKTGEEFIRLPGGGEIAVVTSSAQSRLGNRVTYAPQDEVGIWTDSNGMVHVADTQRRGLAGMGGRAEETSNGWDPSQGSVAQKTAESSKSWDPAAVPLEERALKGRGKDVFRYHPQAPEELSYGDKRQRRKIHQFVYGSSFRARGGHVDQDSIEAEAEELYEHDPGQAERFFGNRCRSGKGSWLRQGLYASRAARRPVPDGTRICLGFDGSDSDDWTAIRAETLDGYGFTPVFGEDRRPTIWNPVEYEDRIPRSDVHAAVDEVFGRFKVVRMYCDPQDWQTEIEGWALLYGSRRVFEWPTNRVAAMHESLVRFVTDLSTGVRTHDGCEITSRHVGNARRLPRPGQRYILGKASQQQKIDAAMSDVLAHEARCDAVAAGAKSTESRRRVVVLN